MWSLVAVALALVAAWAAAVRNLAKALDMWNSYPDKWSNLSKLECSQDTIFVFLFSVLLDCSMQLICFSCLILAGEYGNCGQHRNSAQA